MNYEINVSRDGQHYFGTSPRSLDNVSEQRARDMFENFTHVFPAKDGFDVSLTEWSSVGKRIADTRRAS